MILRHLFGGSRPLPPPRPERTVYAVGDIHGRADLLEAALDWIGRQPDVADSQVVFLGDYIDRGPDSAAVLGRLGEIAFEHSGIVTCLRGNHEQMLLDFLDAPEAGARWLRNGGVETLTSFGVEVPDLRQLDRIRERLAAVLPEGARSFLHALPLSWRSGNLVAVHAALDPRRAPGGQAAETMLWGHPAFGRQQRRDGLWVVHGHRIVRDASAEAGRIAIDTGAFYSGRLTVARISEGAVTFVEAPKMGHKGAG